MSNSDIEQTGTIKGNLPNEASLSGRISNGLNLSGLISIGSGSSDFIIKMTVASDDGNYTVTSCDATIEQIDAAVSAEKRVVVIASIDDSILELPMLQGIEGRLYHFGMFVDGQVITSLVVTDGSTSEWQFLTTKIQAESVDYSNAALPNISTVGGALDELVPKSHTHDNKNTLDKLSDSNGKLTYNGEPIGGKDTIYIPAKLNQSGESFTIETSVTFEQIDTVYKSGQEQILKLFTDDSGENAYILPLICAVPGNLYYFGTILSTNSIIAAVFPTDEWDSAITDLRNISALYVSYGDTNVRHALDDLGSKAHTHANKSVLDKFSVTGDKLQYNGSDVGLKGDKGDTPVKGTDYWTPADKQEIVADTLAALPTWTGGSY